MSQTRLRSAGLDMSEPLEPVEIVALGECAATHYANCVRTVSHTPGNLGQTSWFTEARGHVSVLREVVDRECVGGIWCASARAAGVNFQACAFNHSAISPSLESTICERSGSDYRKTLLQILLFCETICIQRFAGVL